MQAAASAGPPAHDSSVPSSAHLPSRSARWLAQRRSAARPTSGRRADRQRAGFPPRLYQGTPVLLRVKQGAAAGVHRTERLAAGQRSCRKRGKCADRISVPAHAPPPWATAARHTRACPADHGRPLARTAVHVERDADDHRHDQPMAARPQGRPTASCPDPAVPAPGPRPQPHRGWHLRPQHQPSSVPSSSRRAWPSTASSAPAPGRADHHGQAGSQLDAVRENQEESSSATCPATQARACRSTGSSGPTDAAVPASSRPSTRTSRRHRQRHRRPQHLAGPRQRNALPLIGSPAQPVSGTARSRPSGRARARPAPTRPGKVGGDQRVRCGSFVPRRGRADRKRLGCP